MDTVVKMHKAVPIQRRSTIIHDFPYGIKHRKCPHAAIVNITKSGHCVYDCKYCYAKGYPWSGSGQHIEVYANTAERLDAELGSIKICPPLYFCAVTDPFQPLDLVYGTALKAMGVAVKHSVYFTVITKSDLVLKILETEWFDYDRFRVSITCESINSEKLRAISHAPVASRRLGAMQELINAGIDVVARVDPVISGLTDDPNELAELFEALASIGISNITLSTGTFNAVVFKRLLACLDASRFSDSQAHINARYVLTDKKYRLNPRDQANLYRSLKLLCRRYHMTLSTCLESLDPTTFGSTQCATLGKMTVRDQLGHFTPVCDSNCLKACPNREDPPCTNEKLLTEYPFKLGTLR